MKILFSIFVLLIFSFSFYYYYNKVIENGNLEELVSQHIQIEELIKEEDALNENVSKWFVHNHLEHILRANSSILDKILEGQPTLVKKSKSFFAYVMMLTGSIPRGKGESPDFLQPKNIGTELMLNELQSIKEKINKVDLKKGGILVETHPYFGTLSINEWIRFMRIHTEHHLKIIKDIKNK